MRNHEYLTSPSNPLLKEIRKAITRGSLTENGCFVAETFHLLEEALSSECSVRTVIAAESVCTAVEEQIAGRDEIRMVVVPDKLLDAASQGVVALVEPADIRQKTEAHPLVLVIDGVQDPGNLGTILRSAEAFGASIVMLLKGTVNPFNSKVVRSSAGSIFRVPLRHGLAAAEVAEELRQSGAEIYAAMPDSGHTIATADLTRSCAFIIGSEGQGVSAAMRSIAKDLTIPTAAVESLNAAVSAAIILYEARRQRTFA